jgi:hypothetical protein
MVRRKSQRIDPGCAGEHFDHLLGGEASVRVQRGTASHSRSLTWQETTALPGNTDLYDRMRAQHRAVRAKSVA